MPTVIERQTERVRQAKREAIDTINRQRERLAADRSRTEAWRRAEMERIAAEVADRAKAEAQRAWETALAAQEATVEEVR
ncbi:MAG: hypothetical protein K2X91_19525, partial [Thermoleophilia bacterium]|nr:hypothetical protein [Thermoleophilia bacterium]